MQRVSGLCEDMVSLLISQNCGSIKFGFSFWIFSPQRKDLSTHCGLSIFLHSWSINVYASFGPVRAVVFCV
ncbi:hypothetical protein Y032_0087g2008 [Ancylostoma ceylanicum]|uniref:Uncharacterized protein n=1 Tax=Ancylostoma ceylanicum TaxID=53326 RepID=A0A016TNW6_9BILA|nr:hypothetical protein Y032_0087g2008 [Ancylostoma ceylanicum]